MRPLVAALALAACTPPTTTATPDVSLAAPPDAARLPDPCGPARARDLVADARREGDALVVTADNGAAPRDTDYAAPCGDARHVHAWRFVPDRDARVVVELAAPFEAVAWVLDQCAPSGASVRSCAATAPSPDGGLAARATTTHIQRAGAPVWILVASNRRAPREGPAPRDVAGRYTLRVTARTPLPAGAPCARPDDLLACEADAVCAAPDFTEAPRCLRDGTRFARCRAADAGAPCDPGLTCVGGQCTSPSAPGDRCRPGDPSACLEGARCVLVGDAPRCVTEGAASGPCRPTTPPCDEGYRCVGEGASASCLEVLANGASCVGNELTATCAVGSACVGDLRAGGARCVVDGASGGRCRTGGAPCDPSLTCTGDPSSASAVCVPSVALGAPCDPQSFDSACAAPAYCEPGPDPMGRCALPPWTVTPSPAPFVDACDGGQRLALAPEQRDDGHPSAPVALPFSLPFAGARYDAVWPSTNGYAVLGGAAPRDSATPRIPLPGEGAVVAPFFADLVAGDEAALCARALEGPAGRGLALTWRAFALRGRAGSRVDATAVLWASGVVELQTARRAAGTASPDAPSSQPVAGLQRADGVAWARTPLEGARVAPR